MGRISNSSRDNLRAGDVPNESQRRAAQIIEAAYFLIAEKGFEGLRTRDVAEKVGINIATLHYYFPTKEAMISGVVAYLMRELQTSRITTEATATALERLRAEFEDIRARLRESPHQLVVLTELAVRSLRDPNIAHILQHLDRGWRGHLVSIFESGIKEKSFRSDLDAESAANAMMTQLRGLGYQGILDAHKIDQLVSTLSIQTEQWVRVPKRENPRNRKPERRNARRS